MAGASTTEIWTIAPEARPKLPLLVVEARYYEDIGAALLGGATAELAAQGVSHERVLVPGALEIPQVIAAAIAAGRLGGGNPGYCGVALLGCVIRGETSHYDIVCNMANHWSYDACMRHAIAIGNAILTVDTHSQAMARAKGSAGNPRTGKGADAVRACLSVISAANGFRAGQPR